MTGQLRAMGAIGLSAMLLTMATFERAAAVTYHATIIHPTGYDDSVATAISGTSILGQGDPSPGSANGFAFLLDDSTHSVVNLNPDGWFVQPEDVSGGIQVGEGPGPTTGGDTHAILWHGTAASLVDLHPAGLGFRDTAAYGVSGNNQVGYGFIPGVGSHALLWHGSAESVVDLHPAGFVSSQANGVFEDNVAGFGIKATPGLRALLWNGTAASVVDLHSAAYPETFASDASQDSQVGTGIFSPLVGGERHALLWHGTAASVIDLNPPGFTQTGADGVAGTRQVGFGEGTATGGQQHALLWQGSAASVVDLHSLLTGLGPSFVSSYAHDIDAGGVIVGSAVALVGSNYVSYAVKWSPVPEPAAATLFLMGLLMAGAIHRRTRLQRYPSVGLTLDFNL